VVELQEATKGEGSIMTVVNNSGLVHVD